ncbi:hypothetical protein LTS16_017970 [Friedmanniomyces endolithicus]|nr:hypothetical protein LTS16_017970 [Friedmanniomyces endolithicus]
METFTQDYLQAWHDTLEARGKVVMINVLIGRNTLCVPILFDPNNSRIGSDQETFTMLRMWYCLMQLRRGFSELILPRRLVRVDQVEVCRDKPAVEGLEFVRAWDVGAVSMISLTPLLFSLVFVALWIGVCVGHFGVDVQVATTTAFTVAVFVVTAGALVIALFAFLDSHMGSMDVDMGVRSETDKREEVVNRA